MIGQLATIKVQGGKAAEFERLFRNLTAMVKANEPGMLVYQLVRSRTEPNTYRVFEIYRDEAALRQHEQTDYIKTLGGQIGACFDGAPTLELMDAVE